MDAIQKAQVTLLVMAAFVYVPLFFLARRVHREVENSGENGTPLALAVFFVPLIGIPVWLLRRSRRRGSARP